MRTALTIAGSDSSGGAGIQADIKTMTANGVYAMSAITALTAQNTTGVTDIMEVTPDFLKEQLDCIFTDIRPDAVKTGMVSSSALIEVIAERLRFYGAGNIVVDPVMADNGSYYSNMDSEMCEAFRNLIRRADVITPNITEAALLAGMESTPDGHDERYLRKLFSELASLGPRAVAVTGVRSGGQIGNAAFDTRTGETFLFQRESRPGLFYGTGDLFASALSALLVRGASLRQALETATSLTDDSIRRTARHDTPRRFGVDFEGALPAYLRRVEALFGE